MWLAVSSPEPEMDVIKVDKANSWRTNSGTLPEQESAEDGTEDGNAIGEQVEEWLNVTIDGGAETTRHNWSQYKFLSILPDQRMPGGGKKAPRRVIMIGDIHGSWKPLQRLLSRVRYDPKRDKIVHVGDILAKGPESLKVISYMREQEALGVRGNHDQKVVEWRAWMEDAGEKTRTAWEKVVDELDMQMEGDDNAVSTRLDEMQHAYPSDWSWKSEHWSIARKLSAKDYAYLVSLPLTIDIPRIRTVVVHAGLLARDTALDIASPDQPLALGVAGDKNREKNAELTILRHVNGNRSPWNLLNMRSVKHNGEITKSSSKGTPWSELWGSDMRRCRGLGLDEVAEQEGEEGGAGSDDESIERVEDVERRKTHDDRLPSLSCSPVTVVYGHAASRGLDIKHFSKGLDSACVYGKQLTALVLGDTSDLSHLEGTSWTKIGGQDGLLIDVDCKKGGF